MKIVLILLVLATFEVNCQHHFRPEKRIRDRLALLAPKEYLFSEYERKVIDGCNTAKHSVYYTEIEKEFILLMNLARTSPSVLRSFIAHRYDSTFLKQLPSITCDSSRIILNTSFGLHLSARVHAKKSGRKGTIGHQNVDRRVYAFNFYFKSGQFGENCSYSSSSHPLVHFLILMKSKPHFVNIMQTKFNSVGVSFKPHTKFGMNSVTCFGSK